MKKHAFTRPAACAVAALIAVSALLTVQRASAIASTPNAAKVVVSLAAGGVSPAIAFSSGTPVFVMGAALSPGFQGIGSASIIYLPGSATSMASTTWSGINAFDVSTGHPVASLATGSAIQNDAFPIPIVNIGHNSIMVLNLVGDSSGNPNRLSVKSYAGSPASAALTFIW